MKPILMKDLLLKISVSKSTVYNWLNPNGKYYDPTFPKPFKIGARLNAWFLSDIESWLQEQAKRSDSPLSVVTVDGVRVAEPLLKQEAA